MRELFVCSLHNIYLDIHVITKMGYSAEYVERITSLERGNIIHYKSVENATKTNDENEETLLSMGIDPNMLL